MEGSEKRRRICENEGIAGGASGAHTSMENHGVVTSPGYDFEIFLSFRGPDTRATFTNHLYNSLKDAGIRTFKDDEDLRVGEEFAPKLLQAIEQSKILVPIFSKGYATSVWCLKEVAKMVECKETGGQKIIPIFYDVEPAEVRHQIKGYGDAFLEHESKKRCDQKTIEEWKAALNAVGKINGCDLHSKTDRGEGDFVKRFTQKVFNELRKAYLAVSNHFVGVDNHVDSIMEIIGAGTRETRIIGVHGMGGIGKTTVAKIIFNKILHDFDDFEYHCFLSNIRETVQNKGTEYLQHWLISETLKVECGRIKDVHEGRQLISDRLSNKRVLLLLDDVEKYDHIDALVGNRDWLGGGSKVIITTRRIDVLNIPEVDCYYELTGMDTNQSLQLFSKHAFRRDSPLDDYINQSNRAIEIAGGLPLALEVIGSLLCRTKRGMWDAILKKLESVPDNKIMSKLKISYNALDPEEKLIFLDIACLFIGYNKDMLIPFWDESKLFPKVAIDVLENMSLIKISEDNKVWMHDQLRDLGRQMVRKNSSRRLEKQSRVWDLKEGCDLVRRTKVKNDAEALRLRFGYGQKCHFTYEGFENLSGLRFLDVGSMWLELRIEERLLWLESPSNVNPTNENSRLLPSLRWLSWHDIPPAFNIANFSMEDMVILDLSYGQITDEWKGWSHMEVMKNLKILNLSYCKLKRTPNFSAHRNLERLILCSCQKLVEVDGSICQLKRLVFLDLSYCFGLEKLPDELGANLGTLEYLSLNGCRLKRLPKTIGDLKSLIELDISQMSIKKLPDSIRKLKNLKVVSMVCSNIKKVPNALWTIEKLEKIEIIAKKYSDMHVHVGDCIYRNQSLRILRFLRVGIHALPPKLPESLIKLQLDALFMQKFPDLSNLTDLTELEVNFSCSRDDDNEPVEDPIPGWMGNLTKLQSLSLSCYFRETISPADVCLPPQLKSLHLQCRNLRRLPRLPSKLSSLNLSFCHSLCSIGDLSNLKNLSSLRISFAAIVEIQGLDCLENLRDLKLENLSQVRSLPDISNLNKLTRFEVLICKNLVEIQGEYPRSLDSFRIIYCPSLERLPDLSGLMGQQVVEIEGCSKLNVEAFLGYAVARKNPRDLLIKGFGQLQILPDLSNLKYSNKLKHLQILLCDRLVEIQGELPQSLEKLEINFCESLEKLPDMSSLKGLREVCISYCANLVEIRGELPQSLVKLEIRSCQSLQEMPDMSSLKGLCEVCIGHCGNMVEIRGKLPQSLMKLTINYCESLRKLPNISSLMGLHEVHIGECGILVEILGELPQFLEKLNISSCKSLRELPNMSSLMGLRKICIDTIDNLVEIRCELPQSLENLIISFCKSLRELPNMSSLKAVREVSIYGCDNLIEIRGKLPQSLKKLMIYACKSIWELPNMSSLIGLGEVYISICDNLVKIEGELPQSLEALKFFSCESLQELPALSSSMRLQVVAIHNCGNLVKIQGELPQSLKNLSILSCGCLQELPALSSSMGLLNTVEIKHCGKLDVKAIAWLCSEESVKFVGEDRRVRGESESESEYEGEDEG